MKTPEKICSQQIFDPHFGKTATMDVFRNPRTEEEYEYVIFRVNKRPAVVVVALDTHNQLIVLKQYRHAINSVIYELPGGIPDDGDEHRAAQKELLEETGYQTGIMMRTGGRVWFDPCSLDFQFSVFVALNCERIAAPKLDDVEYVEALPIPIGNWKNAIRMGEVVDAKSIVATFLAEEWLK